MDDVNAEKPTTSRLSVIAETPIVEVFELDKDKLSYMPGNLRDTLK